VTTLFKKALWYKEYKEVQALLWGIFAAVFLLLPVQVMQQLGNIAQIVERSQGAQEHLLSVALFSSSPILFALIVVLGCAQLGAERGHNQDDFTLSLPYARGEIYLTKWLLGALTFTVTLAVNFLITYLVIKASPVQSYFNVVPDLWPYALELWLSTLAMYSLTLFLGTIAGSQAFQAALSLIFSFFPMGFAILAGYWLNLHLQLREMPAIIGNYLPELTLVTHFIPFEVLRFEPVVVIDLVVTAVFLVWGTYLYARNRVEYNGRLLVFPSMHTFFTTGITVCFALLGGFIATIGSLMVPSDPLTLVWYYFGALVAGALAYLATRRLLQQPAGLRWSRQNNR